MSDIAGKFKYGAAALWDFLTSKTGAFIIGVSAIAVGWYQFYISRPILKYGTEAMTFISSQNDNDYRVQVKGKEYKDLYQTRVYLYNVGANALSGKDVSKPGHDPIRLVVPKEAGMVHYTLDNTATTEAITAKIMPVNNELVLDFDYLNPDYQIAVSVLHENPTDDIKISGSALNVNEITREWNDKDLKFWGLWGLGLLYFLLVVVYIYHHRDRKLFSWTWRKKD